MHRAVSDRSSTRYLPSHSMGLLSTAIRHRHVCVCQDEDDDSLHSTIPRHVADSLSLPLITKSQLTMRQADEKFSHILCVEDCSESLHFLEEGERYALAIQPLTIAGDQSTRKHSRFSKTKVLPKTKPFWIDLCPPTPTKRSGQPDLLLQAVAPQRVQGGAVVYDLTAGWGQDSLLLAMGGASRVCMVERDPIVASLLGDALRRVNGIAQSVPNPWQQRASKLATTLSLQVGEARQVLKDCQTRPDTLYLDPMFPPRTKTAAVKKGMQILHGLFREDDDDEQETHREAEEAKLLQLAYQMARVKVVVKRPIRAPTLGGESDLLTPSHTVRGTINRWDVYVKS